MWAQVAPTAHEVYAGHCSPHFADGQTEFQGTRSTGLKSESQAVSKAETHTWHFHTVWLHLMKTSPSVQTHLRVINYISENTLLSPSSTAWARHLRCTSYKLPLVLGSSSPLCGPDLSGSQWCPWPLGPESGLHRPLQVCKYREGTGVALYEMALSWLDVSWRSDNPEVLPKRFWTFLLFDHTLISDFGLFFHF